MTVALAILLATGLILVIWIKRDALIALYVYLSLLARKTTLQSARTAFAGMAKWTVWELSRGQQPRKVSARVRDLRVELDTVVLDEQPVPFVLPPTSRSASSGILAAPKPLRGPIRVTIRVESPRLPRGVTIRSSMEGCTDLHPGTGTGQAESDNAVATGGEASGVLAVFDAEAREWLSSRPSWAIEVGLSDGVVSVVCADAGRDAQELEKRIEEVVALTESLSS